MLEVGFAIILGFSIASTVFGLLEDGSRYDKILVKGLIFLILLSVIIAAVANSAPDVRGGIMTLILGSVFDNTLWMLSGAALALCFQVFGEGYLYELWLKIDPKSAPTPEARMGKRAQVAGFRNKKVPATLVGTSTDYLNVELDLYTETLIRLSYSVFEDRSALMMSRLEAELHLGTGRRQRAFHKLVAGHRGRPKVKRITHRYWRSVNGSSRMSQALFGELCRLARHTGNGDRATAGRLTTVGTALGLTVEEMGRASRGKL